MVFRYMPVFAVAAVADRRHGFTAPAILSRTSPVPAVQVASGCSRQAVPASTAAGLWRSLVSLPRSWHWCTSCGGRRSTCAPRCRGSACEAADDAAALRRGESCRLGSAPQVVQASAHEACQAARVSAPIHTCLHVVWYQSGTRMYTEDRMPGPASCTEQRGSPAGTAAIAVAAARMRTIIYCFCAAVLT